MALVSSSDKGCVPNVTTKAGGIASALNESLGSSGMRVAADKRAESGGARPLSRQNSKRGAAEKRKRKGPHRQERDREGGKLRMSLLLAMRWAAIIALQRHFLR